MFQIVLIAVGLSMDAFAVSVSSGICTKELKPVHILRGAFFFGFFQALMPILGWFLGSTFRIWIVGIDHWVAFFLLSLIGGKMIWEASHISSCEDEKVKHPNGNDVRSLRKLFILSIATSIDALAVGLSFSVLGTSIWTPAAIIGLITFSICITGFECGKRIGHLFQKRAELAGGLILIILGTKILVEHLLGLA